MSDYLAEAILLELKKLRISIDQITKTLNKDCVVTLRGAQHTEQYTLTLERKDAPRT